MTTVATAVALESASNLGSVWTTDFRHLLDGELEHLLASVDEVGFTTSGTSSSPVTWARDARQLSLEAATTVDVLGDDHDAVYSTVPPESLYGYVAILVAAKLKIPYRFDRWGTRRLPLVGNQPLVFSIPPSWNTLPATLTDFFESRNTPSKDPAVTVVHAGARLPRLADETVQAMQCRGRRITGVELFGASETGVVAAREFTTMRETPWVVVPDVEVVPNDQSSVHGRELDDAIHLLTVCSARVGRRVESAAPANAVTTGDLICGMDRGTMRIVGRASRRVKPGGSWVDLDHLDGQLRELLPGLNFVTTPIDDPLWGEHIELIVDARGGDDAGDLHQHLRLHSDRIDIVPIRVRTDVVLDWSPMGKVRVTKANQFIPTIPEPYSVPNRAA
ncbi:hypothetical protein ERC79_13600 [Rhodococcus sp. ABRD24]|uniref:hypothetical protein n=1 Tax=Rhodococcus sp. ABRD24 TaxID=2507582 RepID=UPI00103DD4E3|nr:hypothetical protein [Rhodococcus sp. ABRD24]QBJ96868.1 hypothetical protein ERC79_13600 [Rhodococcus sp. ABRD24]